MNILITGITGLFGSYLAKQFAPLGKIHGLKRKESDTSLLGELAKEIEWHIGDVLDYQSLEDAVQGMDLVIHAAGMVSFEDSDTSMLFKINVEGTANLTFAMQHCGVNQLIHISSVAVFSRTKDTLIINENQQWVDSPYNTPYAESKYLGELEVWRAAQEGLEVMVMNPSVLLPKVKDDRSSSQIYHYVLEGNAYYPLGSINCIDIRDAAELVYELFLKGKWGEGYILNAHTIGYQSFFEKMGKAFDKKYPTKPVRPWILSILVPLAVMARKLKISKSPLNRHTAYLAQMKIEMKNAKVQELLAFSYRSLEETLVWAKQNEKVE
jgi:dihydroflavonol-4-reductase